MRGVARGSPAPRDAPASTGGRRRSRRTEGRLMAVAVALFAAVLALIASERVDRTKIALLGAVLLLLTQTIEQHVAIEAIDWNTLGLLAGMMLMVKVTEPTGVYTWLAIKAGQLSRGRPLAVVVSLAATTAVLSPFFDNLT